MALLSLLLPLAGCAAMNQVTALDRLFEPSRFGPQAARAPAQPAPAAPETRRAPAPAIMAMEPRPDPAPVSHALPGGPRSAPVPAAAVPDPEAGLRQTVRQHPWLTRFWSELSLSQQAQVARHLPSGEDASGAWDAMGLGDRARLVIEPGAEPGERRWASGR